jgi:LacI family transcriptional regulator
MEQNSATSRPFKILAVTGRLESPLVLSMTKGIHEVCRQRGWMLRQSVAELLTDSTAHWQPDAVIFMLCDPGSLRAEAMEGRVGISAGSDLISQGWTSVVPDDREIGRQGARHLIDRGFRRLAFFGYLRDPADNGRPAWAVERARGFAEEARAADVSVTEYGGAEDAVTGQEQIVNFCPQLLARWLTELQKPVGILSACDRWAQNLAEKCHDLSFRIPEDVAVVGVDDIGVLCDTCNPPLSSVRIPWERMGRLAAEMAGDAIAGQALPPRLVVVPPDGISVRRSSDALAVDNPDVSAALNIILAHADRTLSVADILRQVPITQRRLERHFKKLVGRRMIDEIRRVHVERAKRLLIESDLPMPVIARRSGFLSSPALSIAFRRETGTTPSKFRRHWLSER